MEPPTDKVHQGHEGSPGRSTALWIVYIVLGVGLILWPFLSFMTVFMWDDSARDSGHAIFKVCMAGLIWFYPGLWGAGLMLSRRALRRGAPLTSVLGPAVIPAASPAVWTFLLIFFPHMGMN